MTLITERPRSRRAQPSPAPEAPESGPAAESSAAAESGAAGESPPPGPKRPVIYLTAAFKLRANLHDRRLLKVALGRWSRAMVEIMERADRLRRQSPSPLLHCIEKTVTARGKERLQVNGAQLHQLVLGLVYPQATALHSAVKMSLVVAIEEQLAGYLGQLVRWMKDGRQSPRPGFPVLPAGSSKVAEQRWELALAQSYQILTLSEENLWRAQITRAARARLLPQYFGAATAGTERGMAHCGLLRREDRRLFALLALWPQGDRRRQPVVRARNRQDRGAVRNVRSETPFTPSPSAQSSIMVPLEYGSGPGRREKRWERLFLERGTPKSAEVVRRGDEFFLHMVFAVVCPPPAELSGNILAIRRGIGTLLAAVVVDPQGQVREQARIDGRQLAGVIAAIQKARRIKQQKGHLLTGDRKASRITEHLIYSAGHQIVDLAYRHGAQIVLLQDPSARVPQRMLAYKHFHRLFDILQYLPVEAGLPKAKERKIYGKWQTCLVCGWAPGDPVRYPDAEKDQCGGCRTPRDPEYHAAQLLAIDVLRYQAPRKEEEKPPPLNEFIRGLSKRPERG